MSDELSPVVQHCNDLATVDEVLGRVCDTDDERAAVKRVLGVDQQERVATDAFTPELPPQGDPAPPVDHVARTRDAITRYAQWVDSHPDDDPTPLRERERVLRIARRNLERLEGDTP